MNADVPFDPGGRRIASHLDHVRRYVGLPWSGGPPEVWAFAYYDTIDPAPIDEVTAVDVVAASAMHPGINKVDLEAFVEQRPALNSWLRQSAHHSQLVTADPQILDELGRFPIPLSLLTKVLHRKRPQLVPPIDRHLIDWYRQPGDPRAMHDNWPIFHRRLADDLRRDSLRATLTHSLRTIREALGDDTSLHDLRYLDISIWMKNQ